MPKLAGRLADDVVQGRTLVHRICGEAAVIPAYQFLSADGTPIDLTPYSGAGYTVQSLVESLDDPGFPASTYTASMRFPATDGIVETDQTSPAHLLLSPGTYQVRYSVTNGVTNFFSDTFYLALTEHGPSPIETLGGYNP